MSEEQEANQATITSFVENVEKKLNEALASIKQKLDGKLEAAIQLVNQRVDEIATLPQDEHRPSREEVSRTKLWADVVHSPPPLSKIEYRSGNDNVSMDLEDEDQPRPKNMKLDLSHEASQFVKGAFSKALSNGEHHGIKSRCPVSVLDQTRCPKINPMFKASDSKFASSSETKKVDEDIQRIQAMMLDVTGPLLELLQMSESHRGSQKMQ